MINTLYVNFSARRTGTKCIASNTRIFSRIRLHCLFNDKRSTATARIKCHY